MQAPGCDFRDGLLRKWHLCKEPREVNLKQEGALSVTGRNRDTSLLSREMAKYTAVIVIPHSDF